MSTAPLTLRRRKAALRGSRLVVGLSAIYATLDQREQIALPYLEATPAVWRYNLDSARWIFGDSLGHLTEIWVPARAAV